MNYRITGIDAKTNAPVVLLLDAPDEAAAKTQAADKGITVQRVETVAESSAARDRPHIQLIELTGKRWKGLLLFSTAVFVVGVTFGGWMLLRTPRSLAHPPLSAWLGGAIAAVGLTGIIVGRVGAWWHHG